MDTQVLLALLALPLVVAGLIVAVAFARRRRSPVAYAAREPVHRLQSESATVQDSVEPAPVGPPASRPGAHAGLPRQGRRRTASGVGRGRCTALLPATAIAAALDDFSGSAGVRSCGREE
jgi:hypothetical protein